MAGKLQRGEKAPAKSLINVAEESIALDSLWASGPTFLTFLRHFGWIFCREWLAQLESHKDEIAAAGLQLVAVAMGEPKHARRYCSKLTADIICLTNKEGDVYRAYGIGKTGWTSALNPDLIKASLRAAAAGHVQGTATGDVAVLGATFIVDTEGIIQYAHYDSHAGDHPDLERLLASVRSRNQGNLT